MIRDTIQRNIRWGLAGFLLGMPVTVAAQSLLHSLESEIKSLVQQAQPAVVTVYANVPSQGKSESLFSFFDSEQPHDSLAHYTRVGTGLFVSKDGYIATRSSIVAQACSVLVRLYDGRETQADIIGLDAELGIALLYIGAAGIEPIAFGNPAALHPGAWTFVLGNSLGHFPAVTMGAINAIHDNGHLQVAVMLTPGNNGSPVLNSSGEIIGMISGAIDFSDDDHESATPFESVLVLPVDQVLASTENLLKQYAARQGWLGITVRPFEASSPQIFKIAPGSPAEQAGVQIGDVITAFNGKELVDYFALKYFVREAKPGDEVILDIMRGKKKVRIPMVASNMPYDGTILKNAHITSSSPGQQQNDGPDAGISAVQRQKLEKRLREMEEQIRQIRMSLARFIDE